VPTPRRIFSLLCLLLAAAPTPGAPLRGQEAAVPEAAAGENADQAAAALPAAALAEQPEGRALIGGPDVYLLPDAAGRLRQILGYRYEDFQRSWNQAQVPRGGAALPAFSVAGLAIEGRVEGREASIRATIGVTLLRSGWTKVPLRLGNLIVQRAALSEESGEEFVTVEEGQPGYAAWLRGSDKDQRTIILEGRVALRTSGADQIFDLQTPAAVTSSVVLEIPYGDAIAETSDAAPTSVEPLDANRSRLKTSPLGGQLSLRWRPREAPAAEIAVPIEAEQQLTVVVEPGRVRYRAEFELDAFGRELASVRVELPPGAELAASSESRDYEIALLPTTTEAGSRLAEIRFREPTATPGPIVLHLERLTATAGATGAERISAPRLSGAFRQSGHLALQVSDALHAYWEVSGGVEQVTIADLPEGLRDASPRAGFAFSAAPWGLDLFVQPRQRRARVRPYYGLSLTSQGAQLDVEYDYRIVGGPTWNLQIDLQGWEFTEPSVESGGSVRPEGVVVTRNGRLLLELADPSLTQVRLRFKLRRDAGLGSLRLPLPQPLDAFMLPAVLDVASEPSLLAVPRIGGSLGVAPLDPESTPLAASVSADRGAATNGQRFQAYLKQAVLALEVSRRPQELAATRTVEARIGDASVQLRQRIDLEVRHQPVTELSLLVPQTLLADGSAALEMNGAPLTAGAFADEPGPQAGWRRLVVPLPRASSGQFALALKAVVPLPSAAPGADRSLTIPLVRTAVPVTATSATISAAGAARIELRSDAASSGWRHLQADAPEAVDAQFACDVDREQLPLLVVFTPRTAEQGPVVDRAWLQTWISGGYRQDRYVGRLWSEGQRVRVRLPAPLAGAAVQTLVDGAPIRTTAAPSAPTEIELELESGYHVIEIRGQRPWTHSGWDRIAFEPPRLEPGRQSGPLFWQVIVPQGQSALATPAGMAPEYRLGWSNGRWGRQPTLSQAQLEQWTGAATLQGPPPSAAAYLYRTLDADLAASVRFLRRGWLVAAASLPLFAAGFALATGRRRFARGLAWAIALGVGAALALAPELGAALAQAALIAVLLTLLAGLLNRGLAGSQTSLPSMETSPQSKPYGSTGATRMWPPETSFEAAPEGSAASVLTQPGSAP